VKNLNSFKFTIENSISSFDKLRMTVNLKTIPKGLNVSKKIIPKGFTIPIGLNICNRCNCNHLSELQLKSKRKNENKMKKY